MLFTRSIRFLLLACLVIWVPDRIVAMPPLSDTELDTKIQTWMEEAGIPAISIAILRNGKLDYVGAFGTPKSGSGDSIGQATLFQAASLSKPVVAYAVLRLVDRHVLDLDTPLVEYLDWQQPVRDGINNEHYGQLIQNPNFVLLTARHVLSHTGGLPNWARNDALDMHSRPGSRFSYSGEGYVLLQKVICDIRKQDLTSITAEEVFKPLGMKHSHFRFKENIRNDYAYGHNSLGNANDRLPSPHANAAASLLTTAGDYARFLLAVSKGQGLSAQSAQAYFEAQIWLDEDCVQCLDRALPDQFSKQLAWGLGWGLQFTKAGKTIWHWGDQGDYKNWVEFNLDEGTGLVYLTNSENGLAIRNQLVADVVGGEHPVFEWQRETQTSEPSFQFCRMVLTGNMDEALDLYSAYQKKQSQSAVIDEATLNRLGYQLMDQRLADAIRVFRLNVSAFPDSFNTYDSLGESLMKQGNIAEAIANYEKSLQLNANNNNAVEMIKKMKAESGP